MKKDHVYFLVGYLVGSFFGVQQVLGMVGGLRKAAH